MSFSNSVLNIRYIITNTHCFAINIPADFVLTPWHFKSFIPLDVFPSFSRSRTSFAHSQCPKVHKHISPAQNHKKIYVFFPPITFLCTLRRCSTPGKQTRKGFLFSPWHHTYKIGGETRCYPTRTCGFLDMKRAISCW